MSGYRELLYRSRTQYQLVSVLLELTYRCNLDCIVCYNDRNLPGKPLSLSQYRKLLDELAEMGVLHLILSGGEPTMHPDFFAIGTQGRSLGFVVRIKSNGHALTREKIRRIKDEIDPFRIDVSLHGATAKTHDAQTRIPGSFDHLLRNLRYAREAGLRIKLNALLTNLNQDEADGMRELADSVDFPIAFTDDITERDNGDKAPLALNVTIPLAEIFSAKPEHATPMTPRNTTPPPGEPPHFVCGTGTTSAVIDPVGNLLPCVEWRRPTGNYHNTPIRRIWEGSPDLQSVRELCRSTASLLLEANRQDPTSSLCIAKHIRSGKITE